MCKYASYVVLGWSSVQFTSSGVSWLGSPTEPCLFHQFANPVCIPALDVSTPALYQGTQSAGQHWLVEHVEPCGGMHRVWATWTVFNSSHNVLCKCYLLAHHQIFFFLFPHKWSDWSGDKWDPGFIWSSNCPQWGKAQIGFGFTKKLCYTACALFVSLTPLTQPTACFYCPKLERPNQALIENMSWNDFMNPIKQG